MSKKRLKPILDKDRYSDEIIKEIDFHLYDLIYRPLLELLEEETGLEVKWNTKKGLIEALHGGKIQYREGYFIGQFSASISKTLREIGGTWDKNRKAFKLNLDALPIEIKAAISASKVKSERIAKQLELELNRIEEANEKIDSYQIPIVPHVKKILEDLDVQFQKVTPKDLVIEPQLGGGIAERLQDQYSKNLNYYIKGWRKDAIYRLREKMEENVFSGFRAKRMLDTIQSEYGVTKNKAKFLARQETSLLLSKYRQDRYEKIGIEKYQWSTSHDARVRHRHKELDGKIFSWKEPPVVDWTTQRRAHPGEDFNCIPEDSEINLAYGIEKLFRRWYTGKLATVVLDSGKTIRATPNHQVLTSLGWKAIGSLDVGDHLIDLSKQLVQPFEANVDHCIPFAGQVFDAAAHLFQHKTHKGIGSDFHGDGTDADVDVVKTFRPLSDWSKSTFPDFFKQFLLSCSYALYFHLRGKGWEPIVNSGLKCGTSSRKSNRFPFCFCGPLKSEEIGLASAPDVDARLNEPSANNDTREPKPLRNCKLAFPGLIRFYDWLRIKTEAIMARTSRPSIGIDADSPEPLREIVRVKAHDLRGFFESHPGIQKFDRVIEVQLRDCVTHVYNLQTANNWYVYNGLIIHNCRCVARPIFEDE